MANFNMAQLCHLLGRLEAQFDRASDATFADRESMAEYIRCTFPEAFR